jgi:hypothetical protein
MYNLQGAKLVFRVVNSANPLQETYTHKRIRVFFRANNSFLVKEFSLINMFPVFLGEITMAEDSPSHNCPIKVEQFL